MYKISEKMNKMGRIYRGRQKQTKRKERTRSIFSESGNCAMIIRNAWTAVDMLQVMQI